MAEDEKLETVKGEDEKEVIVEFVDDRDGFMTPEQEAILEKLYKGKGLDELVDGLVIQFGDNYGLEELKSKIPEETLPKVYQIIDAIFETLKPLAE